MLPPVLNSALFRNEQLLQAHELRALDLTDADLRRLVRAGDLSRVRRGFYTSGQHWERATDRERGLLLVRAVGLGTRRAYPLSHDSTAHALGLEFLQPPEPLVHLTRQGVLGSRTHRGVKHHRAHFSPSEVVSTIVGPGLGWARTACDLTREHGIRTGIGACDSAMRHGVDRGALGQVAERMRGWPFITAVREAVALADPGAENPGESLARLLLVEAGFGRPVTQFPVRWGDRVAWTDMRLGSQVVEFDGRVKYRRTEDGGVVTGDISDVVWRERQREQHLLRSGLGVSRLVWDDLLPQNWDASLARIRQEISATRTRIGSEPSSELLEFADQMTAERARRIAS